MARYRLDVDSLYLCLNARRARLGLTWPQVADQTGLPLPTFTRLKAGRSISAHYYTTLLVWLAPDLQINVPFAEEIR